MVILTTVSARREGHVIGLNIQSFIETINLKYSGIAIERRSTHVHETICSLFTDTTYDLSLPKAVGTVSDSDVLLQALEHFKCDIETWRYSIYLFFSHLLTIKPYHYDL